MARGRLLLPEGGSAMLSSSLSEAQHRAGRGDSSSCKISEASTYQSGKREVATSTAFLCRVDPTQISCRVAEMKEKQSTF